MTTVLMLWGHAFVEVYFWGWGLSKTDNEKHEPNKAEHQQQANVGRAASCSLDIHVNPNGLDVYFTPCGKYTGIEILTSPLLKLCQVGFQG